MTHNFDIPVFILSGVLLAGCLLWLLVDPGKPLIALENDTANFYKNDAAENTTANN